MGRMDVEDEVTASGADVVLESYRDIEAYHDQTIGPPAPNRLPQGAIIFGIGRRIGVALGPLR